MWLRAQAQRATPSARLGFSTSGLRLPFDALEQVNDADAERLCHEMQAGQGDIHPSSLECSDLSPVEAREVCKLILRPATLEAQGLDALAEPLLDFLTLHQKQFGGILLKRILLIRRVDRLG